MHYTFSAHKGLDTDREPLQQPEGTYRELVNGIRTLSGAIQNEPGHVPVVSFLGKRCHAAVVEQDTLYLFLGTGSDSEIGKLSPQDSYSIVLAHAELDFQADTRLSVQAKTNHLGQVVLYFTDGVNPLRQLNTEDVPDTNVADNLRLQTFASLPVPTQVSVLDGGAVPTGVYQLVARHLTRGADPTAWGLLSDVIKVIDDATTADPTQRDGSLPQTPASKSIQVTFEGVDPDYYLLEVGVLTYLGTANTRVGYVVGQLPIGGQTSLRFTYTGSSQHQQDLDPLSISIPGVVYDTARVLNQKDGRLVASNVRASKVDEGVNWQALAELVKVSYRIEEVSSQGDGPYKDEVRSSLSVGYRREECYSLAYAPVFRAYQDRTAYHIPAGYDTNLDVTLSQLQYPGGQGYPAGSIRFHRMPTLQQEPLLSADGQTLRLLGLQVDFSQLLAALPGHVRKEVIGFSLLRQPLTDEYRSLLAQGVVNTHVTYRGQVTVPLPWAGKGFPTNTPLVRQDQLVAFYSPETVILQPSLQVTGIQVAARLEGTQTTVFQHRTDSGNGPAYHLHLDYARHTGYSQVRELRPVLSHLTQYIPAALDGSSPAQAQRTVDGQVISYADSQGYLLLKTQSPVPTGEAVNESYYEFKEGTDAFYMNGQVNDQDGSQGNSSRLLYNLVRNQPRPYGELPQATYYRVGYVPVATPVAAVWGGDTYLSRFSVSHYTPQLKDGTQVPGGGSLSANTAPATRTLSTFWCESSVNVAFRHYLLPQGSEGEPGYVPGTVPYYPKLGRVYSTDGASPGVLNFSSQLGHPRGYNRQYSFTESVVPYSPKSLLEQSVTRFENRSIYTPVALEGEQQDQWRIFLPTDYHDIPRQFGPITDTFVYANTFYHQTPGATYRSFTGEAQTMQVDDGTETYLSSGAFFARPSEPLLTVDGGYAGTQGQWGLDTPEGHYFVDAYQHKLWVFNGQFQDLSAQGQLLWSEEHLVPAADTLSEGYRLVRDYHAGFPRVLLTRLSHWTRSYSPGLSSWTGSHSYLPGFMVSRRAQLYLMGGSRLFRQLSAGNYGKYLGQATEPLRLVFSANVEAKTKKRWDNLVLTEEVRQTTGEQVHQASITGLQVHNDRCNTGPLTVQVAASYQAKQGYPVLGTVLAERKQDKTNLALPCDLVLDPDAPTVLATSTEYRPRVTGLFALLTLTYDNVSTHRYTLQSADVLCRSSR